MRQPATRNQQRGISLFGLLFWGVVIACTAVVGMRVFPSVLEYYTIQGVITRIAKGNPATVPVVRQEFDRIKQVEYSIVSISGSDLVVSKDNDRVQISFSYEKEIELVGPAFLLLKYQGQSK